MTFAGRPIHGGDSRIHSARLRDIVALVLESVKRIISGHVAFRPSVIAHYLHDPLPRTQLCGTDKLDAVLARFGAVLLVTIATEGSFVEFVGQHLNAGADRTALP